MLSSLRLATPADAPGCLEIYRPFVEASHTTFETDVPSTAEFAQRIAATLVSRPWIVAEEDGGVVGYAYASPIKDRAAYQWTVEVAVYVAEGMRGRGVGRKLYEALFRCLAGQGFVNAIGIIALPNPASIALHESLGFERVSHLKAIGFKLGAWHDSGWWQKRLADPPSEPEAPRPLASCRAEVEAWIRGSG
jgi:phosphinothricin acetyltransferase